MTTEKEKKIKKQLSSLMGPRPGTQHLQVVQKNQDEDAEKISMLHISIETNIKNAIRNAIKIGELLIEKKSMLGHGKFIPWIATNLPFSERTAQRYIKLFENRDLLNTTPVSDLKSAYKLLSSTDHEEKEINPKEISKVDAKKLYKKFKAGEKIGSKDRGLIKEFLSNERERILSTAKTKVARIDEDIKSLS
ncbi:DUF3102 domain-containing protein (plasmid) [Leptospira interrogans serovar Canicola]|uniref:DUF3102 domain-containing protein n=3 Tax=Leptospira interrogans TaxID=173 RepID=A0AAQ0B0J0_LEPIR|nr:DUF3102 domain-containing protein [Leptospira interrogans]QOI45231.1 DUF3102 domain-containing protein [Leptospira interrogans serovar Canicola]QOI53098.1 DUF3102 domain-containing protein [Leptospira interrogans serovar Bataviae]